MSFVLGRSYPQRPRRPQDAVSAGSGSALSRIPAETAVRSKTAATIEAMPRMAGGVDDIQSGSRPPAATSYDAATLKVQRSSMYSLWATVVLTAVVIGVTVMILVVDQEVADATRQTALETGRAATAAAAKVAAEQAKSNQTIAIAAVESAKQSARAAEETRKAAQATKDASQAAIASAAATQGILGQMKEDANDRQVSTEQAEKKLAKFKPPSRGSPKRPMRFERLSLRPIAVTMSGF
jgi:hypothetical protein